MVKNLPEFQEIWVQSLGGEGNGNPLQYSHLGNPVDRGAWRAAVLGVTRISHDLATKLISILLKHGTYLS